MKQKKLVAGVVATAMVLSTGAAAYAAEAQTSDQLANAVESEAAIVAASSLSVAEQQLPDGVAYRGELLISDEAGTLAFDVAELPDGVQFAQEVSANGEEATTLTESISVEYADGTLTFDVKDLPEGVQFAQEGSNSVFQGGADSQ